MDWREQDGIPWLEARLDGAVAVFSTRQGGASVGPYASLNLGWITGDEPDRVRENRLRLAGAAGFDPERTLTGFQVHGAEVVRHSRPPDGAPYLRAPDEPLEADGHAAAEAGIAALVLVADCLPVALAGPAGVAMLHCGWRGLAGGIVARGVREVEANEAAIGPGIGSCCYEVGEEVLQKFEGLGDGVADGRMLDLAEVAARLLEQAGVPRVERSGLCTSCEEERFFSHRRDGDRTGRQAGAVWRT